MPAPVDLAVVGLGPAGRALAHRAAAAGLTVTAIDPKPDRVWTQTLGMWADEAPGWLPPAAIAARIDRPAVAVPDVRALARPYLIVDTAAAHRAWNLPGVTVYRGRTVGAGANTVYLDDGTTVTARAVVDATGLARRPDRRAEQTAYGVIVGAEAAAPALGGQQAWFMDWRTDDRAGPGAPRSFLYAMPVGDDAVLLEETCLAGRPALPLTELRDRLHRRLAARGVSVPTDAAVERVRFALHGADRRPSGALGFGARGGLIHPATGYSLGAALGAVDPVVAALAAGRDPYRELWPRRARLVAALRRRGLEALLALDPAALPEFFAVFFALPAADQRAYLSGRADPVGVARAMARVFTGMDLRARAALAGSTLRSPRHRPVGGPG